MLTDIIKKHDLLIGEIKEKMNNQRIFEIENNYHDSERNLSLSFQAEMNRNGSSFHYNISGKRIKESSYETFERFYEKLVKIYGFQEANLIVRGFLNEIAKRNKIINKEEFLGPSIPF